ncbi:hypothetical protein HHI36_014159 [Cryptolaemus montrouzieri]|uniref:Anaphase-promoting complex subunit 4-like WD40 domain-containing protein n=1 Tax=Cryptolaemus montrouzieri TaxID=559131 RepID=A0ABD2N212_9CUCU
MNTSLDYSTSDRFIPLRRRSSDPISVPNVYPNALNVTCNDYCDNYKKNDSGVNYMQHLYKTSQYNNLLINKMFSSPRRVLYFSPKQRAAKVDVTSNWMKSEESWPVKARRKPLIGSPDLILDMPGIEASDTGRNQRVDWGATGFIAAIHRDSIYTHNPDTNWRIFIKSDEDLGDCIKWSPDGTQLAMSLKYGKIGVWDIRTEKIVHMSSNRLFQVSCMVYTSRQLITGDDNGVIQTWSHSLLLLKTIYGAHSNILNMKVSCNERYLATYGTGSKIKIWALPMCKEMFYIFPVNTTPLLALDWHPWKESLLAIGQPSKDSLCTLWNINHPEDIVIDEYSQHRPKIDCLAFNPISAELAISFWLTGQGEDQYSQNIVVQSSLNRIVDDMNFHTTRTPYLLWDKDGKRLASVGADENLAIWDFFGADNKEKCKKTLFPKKISILEKGTIR